MSLTSVIHTKEMRELFKNEFTRPKGKLSAEIKASPLTKNYSMVGTAFDYLLRFGLKYHNPKSETKRWVAETAVELATECEGETCIKKMTASLQFAKSSYARFLKTGTIGDEILKSSILLAQLDPYYRAGMVNEDIIGVVNELDIRDLRNMISLVDFDKFKSPTILLNPTFNEGSSLVGGADADLVIGNQIVDIKTIKEIGVTSDMFNQIIGYYTLAYIGGIGSNKLDVSNITEVGFYFSRYGIKHMYSVSDVINPSTFPKFVDRFKSEVRNVR
jgi:hypothetical protein